MSYGLIKRDLVRISAACSILTEQFRGNSITFALIIGHVQGRHVQAVLDVTLHVEDVEVELVVLDVDAYTGKPVKFCLAFWPAIYRYCQSYANDGIAANDPDGCPESRTYIWNTSTHQVSTW